MIFAFKIITTPFIVSVLDFKHIITLSMSCQMNFYLIQTRFMVVDVSSVWSSIKHQRPANRWRILLTSCSRFGANIVLSSHFNTTQILLHSDILFWKVQILAAATPAHKKSGLSLLAVLLHVVKWHCNIGDLLNEEMGGSVWKVVPTSTVVNCSAMFHNIQTNFRVTDVHKVSD